MPGSPSVNSGQAILQLIILIAHAGEGYPALQNLQRSAAGQNRPFSSGTKRQIFTTSNNKILGGVNPSLFGQKHHYARQVETRMSSPSPWGGFWDEVGYPSPDPEPSAATAPALISPVLLLKTHMSMTTSTG
jgi:hypothetical protein